jgi:arylsulfatase A-like enzyme
VFFEKLQILNQKIGMKIRKNIGFCLLLILVNISKSKTYAQSTPPKQPNIVFILADDMGWIDWTVNGSQYYDTPHLERLAKRGKVFKNAYTASPLCSPTRASILSGQYPERFHLTTPSGHLKPNPNEPLMKKEAAAWNKVVCPESRSFMPLETVTIAEKLKKAGYATGFIGKWHLGQEPYSPENQGFSYNVGGGPQPGPPNYFSPFQIKNLPNGRKNEYITDRITDEALQYLEAKKDSAFFLCLWEFAVHAPFQAKLAYIKEYENKRDPRGKQDNPIMAGMIKSLDESVGKIMDKLDELKLTDNTLIVFYSDNGGNMYDIVNGKDATNNFPLKMGKGNIHEGGIKVPCVVSWAGKIKPNTVSQEVISSIDFYPTFLEMAGLKPDNGQIIDGESLLPVLTNEKKLKREAIYCHFPHYVIATDNYPSTAVRKGDYKLIKVYGQGENQGDAYELYDLKNDEGETTNLATKNPKVVKKLAKLIVQHVEKTEGITPIINPKYNPKAKSPMGERKDFPTDKYPNY